MGNRLAPGPRHELKTKQARALEKALEDDPRTKKIRKYYPLAGFLPHTERTIATGVVLASALENEKRKK